MLAEIKNQRVLNYGAYDVTRADGSKPEFVLLMDPSTSETYTLSLDAGLNGSRAPEFSVVDLQLDGVIETKVVNGKDGRARAAKPAPKFKVMGMTVKADKDGQASKPDKSSSSAS